MEDLINCFFGWEVDVLDDICPVDERRVCKADVKTRFRKTGGGVKGYFVNAPIAFGRLLVAMTRTFFLCLSLSSCVRSALTTCGL